MGSDKDPSSKDYVPRFKKTSLQYEDKTIYISLNPFGDENHAKTNITFDTKIKIVFPDEDGIVIDKNPDLYKIKNLQNNLFKYISKNECDELKKIEVFYMSYYEGPFGIIDKDVPDNKKEKYNTIIESLKKKLTENKYSMNKQLENEIVNEYLCDFMNILGYEKIAEYESPMGESTAETSTQEVSRETFIPTLSGEDNSHDEQTELTQTEQVDLPVTQDIDFASVFVIGQTNVLYSDSGVGKTLMSIDTAKSNHFRRCLFILVDTAETDIAKRRYNILGGKADFLWMKTLNQKKEVLKMQNEFLAYTQIKFLSSLNKSESQSFFDEKEISNYVKRNIEYIDGISIIEKTINEAEGTEKYDFVCIDSLNGFERTVKSLDRDALIRIAQLVEDNKLTLLCLNHTAKYKKEMAGKSDIREVVDNIYLLSPDIPTTNHEDNEVFLLIVEEKKRFDYGKKKAFHIKVISDVNSPNPQYKLVSQQDLKPGDKTYIKNPKNIPGWIERILSQWPEDTISFEDLKKELVIKRGKAPDNDTSISNSLGKLAENGVIEMVYNNSWSMIKIVRE